MFRTLKYDGRINCFDCLLVGLHEAINDIQNMWRAELSDVLEVANALSENLAVLTKRLERCQLNHLNIVQNLQADHGE